MGEGGLVRRDTVILVLKIALGESASVNSDKNKVTITKDGIPYAYQLAEEIGRLQVQKFANKFGVNVDFFYHPERLHKTGKSHH